MLCGNTAQLLQYVKTVKICSVIRIKSNQLADENARIITILAYEEISDVATTDISQSLPHIMAGIHLA